MSQKQTALSDVDAFGRAVYAYFAYCTVDWNNTVNVWILTPNRSAAKLYDTAETCVWFLYELHHLLGDLLLHAGLPVI